MYARIVPIFLILPFLNTSAIGNILIRNGVIFMVIVGLWPSLDIPLGVLHAEKIELAALVIKEALVGGAIGFALVLPFWIFSAMGAYIDVARGASMGSLLDPTSGQESTEGSNYINFCVLVVYLELGGMRMLLEVLTQSYQTIGLLQGFTLNFNSMAAFLSQVVVQGFVVCAPVLLMLLLTECLLGLFSRFTPQLNAFSLSLTIKTSIAFFVLLVYFWQILAEKLHIYMTEYANWRLVY
jgi:type III secretion protein T